MQTFRIPSNSLDPNFRLIFPSGEEWVVRYNADSVRITDRAGKIVRLELRDNRDEWFPVEGNPVSGDDPNVCVETARTLEELLPMMGARIRDGWIPSGGVTPMPLPGYPGIKGLGITFFKLLVQTNGSLSVSPVQA